MVDTRSKFAEGESHGTLVHVNQKDGVVVATYKNPPMNYFCADGTRELVALIEKWKRSDGPRGRPHRRHEREVHHALQRRGARRATRTTGRRCAPPASGSRAGYHAMLDDLRALPKPVIVGDERRHDGRRLRALALVRHPHRRRRATSASASPRCKPRHPPRRQRHAEALAADRRWRSAIEFVLRSRVVRPEEALALGLVHELADDAEARATEIAHRDGAAAAARGRDGEALGLRRHRLLICGRPSRSRTRRSSRRCSPTTGALAMKAYVDAAVREAA